MDVTYSHGGMACADAEVTLFVLFTPPYKSYNQKLSRRVRLGTVYGYYHRADRLPGA